MIYTVDWFEAGKTWVVRDDKGRVLSSHASQKEAETACKASLMAALKRPKGTESDG